MLRGGIMALIKAIYRVRGWGGGVCPILQVFIIDRSRRTGIECPKTTLGQNRARIRRGV